ncbi:MAG: tetratricopeptide repeat protein [Alcaligenaceae bacterium]|jgi:Tfp pilus assembly protein PilF|nr:tetratricopeptide repeat protein [Alcaligenaceae bacterium]
MKIQQFEAMLEQGRDSPMLRYSLGKLYLEAENTQQAIVHLENCLEQDPVYSAAWSLLGKAYLEAGDVESARQTWEKGVVAAENKGDIQTMKMMNVFLKRLDKTVKK